VGEFCGHNLSLIADTVDGAQDQASSILLPKLVEVTTKTVSIHVDWENIMKKIQQV
jgi:hypothetical protein